ncbi:MAG: S8 family peptidase [Sulfurovum sp.]|nr:S8 family peptidase [Sulfurovum sp.]
MIYGNSVFHLLFLLFVSFIFTACGSGDASDTAEAQTVVQSNVALGPVSDAKVTVFSLDGTQLFETNTGTFDPATDLGEDNRTLVDFKLQKVGKFTVKLPSEIDDQQWLRIKTEGGINIDPDNNGIVFLSDFKAINGSLSAYVKASDLMNGYVTVNVFTTLVAEFIRQQKLTSQTEISAVLTGISKLVFQEDSADMPLHRFNPAKLDANKMIADVGMLADVDLYQIIINSKTIDEVYSGASHIFTDTDKDGLFDDFEQMIGSSSDLANSDGDDLSDYGEIFVFSHPNQNDTALFEDILYPCQWHLNNTGQDAWSASSGTEGNDIDVGSVWKSQAGSRWVTVGVVDTGIEAIHPDLAGNLDLNKSIRYSDGSTDPTPNTLQLINAPYASAHGTACAGLIAAKGWNGIGVRGVAPFTKLAGFNVFSSPGESNFMNALSQEVDISSNSWGYSSEILIKDPLIVSILRSGSINGREGKGTVFVFAAGNDRDVVIGQHGQGYHIGNANNAEILNNPYVITVAAVDANGHYASYSNFGANILVSAPGGEDGVEAPAIVTTDLTGLHYGFDSFGFARDYRSGVRFNIEGNEDGNYTNNMNGTSFAAPIVSGTAALILAANPSLTYRDVQYILATTAVQNDPEENDWTTNGAGYHINHNYGFGLINVADAVSKAETFISLNASKSTPMITVQPNTPIPDNDEAGIVSSIELPSSLLVEHVDVWVNIADHPFPGDLDITLISPAGTESRLAYGGGYYVEGSYENWRFSTVRCLDEDAQGRWRLIVKDLGALDEGTLSSWSLQVVGR